MSGLPNLPKNRLLRHLSPANLRRLMPELEEVRCERGQILMDADNPITAERAGRARAWFDSLRDRLVAAFEALEDEAPADLPRRRCCGDR